MKKHLLLLLVLLSCLEVKAQYTLDTLSSYPVGPGVTYTKIRIASLPLNMDLLTVDLKNPFIKLESVKGTEKLDGGREVLSSMIKRHTSTNHSVVGGVNADFFDLSTGRPINIQVENGEVLRGPISLSTIGFDVNNKPMLNRVQLGGKLIAKDTAVTIGGVNTTRGTDKMILYNSYMGATTNTNAYGTEALVHPVGNWLVNDTVVCVIDTIVSGVGKMPLSAGKAVLSGHGVMDAFLKTRVSKGDTVKVYVGVTPGLAKLKEMLGGYPKIVSDGVNYADQGYREEGGPDHTYNKEPRTAAGFSKDSTKLYLFIADGRNPGVTVGVTLPQLADIMLQVGVYQGLNFDGGGSSEMMVRGSIMNVPSDGSERPLANSLLVISTAPNDVLNSVIISPKRKQVFRGDKAKFSAVGNDKYYNPIALDASKVAYSCDPKIGTIDNTGLFTAANLNTGSGYVYMNYETYKDSALVTFKPIGKIAVSPRSFSTDTVKTVALKLQAYDTDNVQQAITFNDIKWSYSDAQVGSVDINGVFKGKKEGKTKLIADYSGIKDTIDVSVVIGKDTRLISEMEEVTKWTVTGTGIDLQNTKLSVSTDVKSTGQGSLKVDYSFTFDGVNQNKLYLDANPPIEVYGLPDTLMVDGRSDSASHRIYIILSDDNQELFRAYSNKYLNSAGKFDQVTVPVKSAQEITTGSYFNFPLSITRIEVQLGSQRVKGTTYTGTFYLDNLRARYPLQTTGVEDAASSAKPEGYGLRQNYPNPFNPSTMIEFRTREVSHVSLRVYDMLGREIAVLMDKEMPAGSYKVSWNAQGFASGVYFYRLQTGNTSEIRKMMLVR